MSEEAAIRKMYDRYLESVNTGNLDSWVSFNTADCVWLAPGHAPVQGPAAISTYGQETWFGVYEMDHAILLKEIVETGDSDARAWGTWTIDVKPKDGSAAQSMRGNFLDVLRKESDGWKFSRVCFNITE